ncbi:MAG: hypothetical protein ACRDZ2_10195 [Ilumatobacteraceae bacterium]
MVGRKRSRVAKEATPTLTVHQVVAHNFTRARQAAGWTQVETSERLEPFLGYRLNQAGVSAIEKTYDSERRRNIDAAEIVAFARCFNRPIGWFFLPPTGHAAEWVEPLDDPRDERYAFAVADLTKLVIGTPDGWKALLDRIDELLDVDHEHTWDAISEALDGVRRDENWEHQIDLRRRALQQITLARLVGPEDEAVTRLAAVLIDLVKLTPLGYRKLRDTDPDQALALLAEADQHVESFTTDAEQRRTAGESSTGGFDDLEPIEPAEALGLRDRTG